MRRRTSICILAGMMLAAQGASAAQRGYGGGYEDGDGQVWRASFNANGAVLRLRGATIYLGRGCDAYSPQYGRGRWEWANGGFLVVFRGGRRVGFPRQEIDAGQGGNCQS
ncbi:MAG TPA: hypothetical protein VGB54_15080 [Allosphingosinicella sp.]